MFQAHSLSNEQLVKVEDGMVCVIDDDAAVCRSLERLFRSWKMRVKTYSSGRAYLASREDPAQSGPRCLILDLRMPGEDGLALQRGFSDRTAPIIFLSGNGDVTSCATAMKAGAVDFLTKPVDEDKLISAVNIALQVSLTRKKQDDERAATWQRFQTLTAREAEVMTYVISGILNKQIAHILGAAEKTIKIHRGRLMAKMGVRSVADLIRSAQTIGLRPRRQE